MIEIVVASGKGGVGKSTVSSSFIYHLHLNGRKVVAVDADADAPNLHLIFGVREWRQEREYREGWVARIDYGRCDDCGICARECPFKAISLAGGKYVINEVICEGCLTCSLVCTRRAIYRVRATAGKIRWGVTPYGFPIVGAELTVGRPNSGKLVTEVKALAREVGGQDAVYVVDAAAGIGCQVVSSLAGANGVVLVAEPTPASFADMKRMHRLAKHFMLPSALIINKADINPRFVGTILEYAKNENIDFLGEIPYDDTVPKSMTKMRPLLDTYPNSKAGKALRELAYVFEERVVNDWWNWFRKYRPAKPEPYRPVIIKPRA